MKTKLTPGELAKQWGVSVRRVMQWIKSGELRAMDASVKQGGVKPRYLIDVTDLSAFENRRTVNAEPKVVRRKKRKPHSPGFIEYV